jgi:lipoyl(octanoyl) transferase
VNDAAAESSYGGELVVRTLGLQEYEPLWRDMQRFTNERDETTPDELWFTEHPPVFTLGLNAAREHLLAPGDIPVIQIDRGGQVTYHGPGQLMVYPLIDLKRSKIGVRDLVTALEQSVVDLMGLHDIVAVARADAPGVYVDGRKIASVGLRIRRGSSYHGMALNIDVDLEPFSRINPCGFNDLEVTDLRSLGVSAERLDIQSDIQDKLLNRLGLSGNTVIEASTAD